MGAGSIDDELVTLLGDAMRAAIHDLRGRCGALLLLGERLGLACAPPPLPSIAAAPPPDITKNKNTHCR